MPKAACLGPRRLRAAASMSIAACALLLVLSAAAVAQETGRNLPMCWSPEMLAAKPDDHKIQSAGRGALRAAPKRTPVAGQPLDPSRRLAIRRVDLPPGVKLVALTFDLCEQPHEIAGYQGAIVDYLRAERVKATFFAGGKWMLTHRDRTQQLMADPLFEIGNHAWEHRNLRLLRGPALVERDREHAGVLRAGQGGAWRQAMPGFRRPQARGAKFCGPPVPVQVSVWSVR